MSLTNEVNGEIYRQMAELQEKLRKSEEERMRLEEKFRFLMKSCREEEEIRLRNLQERYSKFLEECSRRSDRNDRILRSLEKVESGANIVFAKTERLKVLRNHYEAYLERIMPNWKQPSIGYKSPYSSTAITNASFRPSYTSRLTTSNDCSGNHSPKHSTRDVAGSLDPELTRTTPRTLDSDSLRNERKPLRSYTNGGFSDPLSYKRPSLDEKNQFLVRDKIFENNYEDLLLDRKNVKGYTKPIEEVEKIVTSNNYDQDIDRKIFQSRFDVPTIEELPLIPQYESKDSYEKSYYEEKGNREVEKECIKESQEIECLAEKDEPGIKKQENVAFILSDEEIAADEPENRQNDVEREITKYEPEVPKQDEIVRAKRQVRYLEQELPKSPKREPIVRQMPGKGINVGKLAPDITSKFEASRNKFQWNQNHAEKESKVENEVFSPEIKKSVLEHQKSIDKLKAALSTEEDDVEKDQKIVQKDEVEKSEKLEEETDVTESSSEVWHDKEKNVPEEWRQPEQPADYGEVDEIENKFAEIVTEEYQEQPYYEGNPGEIDYNEETYPESYYEQPQPQPHYQTNISSNVILEEDEYEAEQQDYVHPVEEQYQQNEQYENYQYEQTEPYPEYQEQSYEQNQEYVEEQQNYNPDFNQENYVPQEYLQESYDQNYVQEGYDPDFVEGSEYNRYEEQIPYQEQPQEEYQGEYNQEYQQQIPQDENYQDDGGYPQTVEEVNQEHQQPKQSNLAHLLESDSESYQIEPGNVAGNEDSDFDFSISQKQ